MHEAALMYAKKNYSMPPTAFRLFLWPGDFIAKIQVGPTTKITMGVLPGDPRFMPALKSIIDRIASQHLYSTMAVVKVAHILEQDAQFKRWVKERYNFDWELIPGMLRDEELTIRQIQRIEVVHKATGIREVIEHEAGSTFAARDIAKLRLARRVREHQFKKASEGKDNNLPFSQIA